MKILCWCYLRAHISLLTELGSKTVNSQKTEKIQLLSETKKNRLDYSAFYVPAATFNFFFYLKREIWQ